MLERAGIRSFVIRVYRYDPDERGEDTGAIEAIDAPGTAKG
jgi:hypothetical protein